MFTIIRSQLATKLQHYNHILFRESQGTVRWPSFARSPTTPLLAPATTAGSIRSVGSDSAAYDGDGKTTVTVLNNEDSHLNLVNTYSAAGFRLQNNLFITGSILLFPTNVFSWNVKRAKDITLDSLVIFDLIVPKTKIVIIGYGQYGEEYDASIPIKLKKKGISCEMLATPNAVTTYNYLVHDSVLVAGAFIPVKDEVFMEARDIQAIDQHDSFYKELDYARRQSPHEKDSDFAHKEFVQKYSMKDKGKKKFDDDQ
jgi:NADH dehydrogenase [ubiquinone] 1 alpha subcomplex assembly factor 3